MARPAIILLNLAAATGTDTVVGGGRYHLVVTATAWGGATAKLSLKAANGAYLDVGTDATFTGDGQCIVDIGDGVPAVRGTITGGPPTGVTMTLYQVPGVR